MMRKSTKKMVALLAVVVAAMVLMTPEVRSSIFSSLGTPMNCEIAPYDSECVCGDTSRKIYVPWIGIPKWSCESLEDLLLDPESPTFESDAVTFATDYLSKYCGDVCTDLECGPICGSAGTPTDGDKCISASYGYSSTGERLVNIECVHIKEWVDLGIVCSANADCGAWTACRDGTCHRPGTGSIPWRMNFLVESETWMPKAYDVFQNYCVDPQVTERCEPPIDVMPTPISYMFGAFSNVGSSGW